jgi:predicted  nucleic acid-binding Zn-ribbon protein
MKSIVVLFIFGALPSMQAGTVNPIEKVLSMISDLQGKVLKEAADAQKMYTEYAEFCEDRAQALGFEIKTGKSQVAELQSSIEKNTATMTSLESKIEDLSSDIGSAESDLKAATVIREKEAADFGAEEAELKEVIDSLERAISILTKEMAKSGASMIQLKSANSITQAFSAMVQAAAMSADDATKLTALVQERQQSEDEDGDSDSELGAPAAATYEGHSDGIIGVLEGLLEKAEAQLDKARKAESTAQQNYDMLKQSLSDEMKFAKKDMDEAKSNLAEAQEAKSVAEGDLSTTTADLAGDRKAKEELHHDCMSAAQEFEAGVTSRGEELGALAKAKKVIQEATGGATDQTYLNQVSFVQTASRAKLQSKADLTKFEAVRFIRDLAKKHRSAALAQLASRMTSAVRFGSANGQDPFAKVKGLIVDMISTLEAEAEADATHKAYCDKEMSETKAKLDEKTADVDSLTTKIDQKKAMSIKLKEEVSTLQNELAGMAKAQAEATKLRQEENAAYKTNKAEMEQGLKGVRIALKVLKDYYAKGDKGHEAAEGAGAGIIGLLEVVESDFSKGLAEIVAEEEEAAMNYETATKANEVETTTKDQDVKYKTKEFKGLDKAVTDLSGDLSGAQEELDAIMEYSAKIKEECVAKPEPYEERKKRREQEIAGLKEGLTILEGESFLQKSTKHTLRGIRHQ